GPALGIFAVIFYMGLALASQIGALFVLAGTEHLTLMILGGKNLGGYTVTVRAHALGLSPYLLGLVAFCGPGVMGIWSPVVRGVALSKLQRVSGGKAAAAILAPFVVICPCFFIVYIAAIGAAMGAATGT